MQKRQLLINAFSSVMQIIISGGVLFILYRFLLKTIGVDKLGVWSLVLATTSVTGIAQFGLSGSVVKFVAKYKAHDDIESVSGIIQTASISLSVFIGIMLLIFYPLAKWILTFIMAEKGLSDALLILPFSLVSFWIGSVSGIFQSGIDGCQRIDQRTIVMVLSSIFYLLICMILVPKYGLLGLAYTQIGQSIFLLMGYWILLKRQVKMPIIPMKWDSKFFKEIFSYGINFQIISIVNMLFDPITKALLSRFGGLSVVGFYEMATRMVSYMRSFIISANQVIVPAIADLQENDPEKIKRVYLLNYQLLFFLSLPLFSTAIISAPIISEIWIGYFESNFVFFTILLSVGWFLNVLAGPAYFMNLGTGELKWNVISHIAIGIMNLILGLVLGKYYGGIGVVAAWVISLSLGSSVIYISYHFKNNISLESLIPKESRLDLVIYLNAIILLNYIYFKWSISINKIYLSVVISSIFSIVVFFLSWHNPMGKYLIRWLRNSLFLKRVV